ncbi:MAG TPA: hypothetical protein VMW58_05010 [Anaerolineae bacterium]|nr:hypothetical protein [Anaerolineae bacterium]
MSSTRDPQLRIYLRQFVQEALAHLRHLGELPRPRSAPLGIAGRFRLEQELGDLASYKALDVYLAVSGIAQKLVNAGHCWAWHREVFSFLFIEQYLNSSRADRYDPAVFATIYRRAESEIFSHTVTLRRISMIHGIPVPPNKIHLERGLTVVPCTLQESRETLQNMLWQRFQPRPLDCLILGKGALLVNDIKARKDDDGRPIMRCRDDARLDERLSLLAMRLCCDGFIYAGPLFEAELSRFPLWPAHRWDPEESRLLLVESNRQLTGTEARRLRISSRALKRLANSPSGGRNRAPALRQALRRFDQSFRPADEESNIVDLVVALEALYLPEGGGELRYRMATNVANLLGHRDEQRLSIFRQVLLAYDIRNTLVHGRTRPLKDLTKHVRNFLSEAGMGRGQGQLERDLEKVGTRLRQMVRDSIQAYFGVTQAFDRTPELDRWPDIGKFNEMGFDAKARRELQKLARVPKA